MQNYPIGIQDFEKIRKGGFVYVDKTDLVYKLTRGSVYSLGRPRRFGKSLLVSKLKYYFEGRRDLFEGLKIAELEKEWQKLRDVYNPFSIINVFADRRIKDYWFTSGTPSFLMRLLSKCSEDVMQYTGRYYDEDMFINYKADTALPLPMIFQSGYLTIKDVNREFNTYLLGFPNREVREGLTTLLVVIFEFKLDGTAAEALQQIKAKGHVTAYAADPRPLFCIGASFGSKTGTVEEWKTEG